MTPGGTFRGATKAAGARVGTFLHAGDVPGAWNLGLATKHPLIHARLKLGVEVAHAKKVIAKVRHYTPYQKAVAHQLITLLAKHKLPAKSVTQLRDWALPHIKVPTSPTLLTSAQMAKYGHKPYMPVGQATIRDVLQLLFDEGVLKNTAKPKKSYRQKAAEQKEANNKKPWYARTGAPKRYVVEDARQRIHTSTSLSPLEKIVAAKVAEVLPKMTAFSYQDIGAQVVRELKPVMIKSYSENRQVGPVSYEHELTSSKVIEVLRKLEKEKILLQG